MTPELQGLRTAPSCDSILICFAVPEESRSFSANAASAGNGAEVLVTGMGARNAVAAVTKRLDQCRFDLVLTCGFAGALTPALKPGQVVFSVDDGTPLGPILLELGALPVSFHCATRVASTVPEKKRLAERTGCLAVEMESEGIRTICRARGIPSGTVRVISDGADEDLPLDFNAIMTEDVRIDYAKLAGRLVRSPGKIPALLRFQRQTRAAAQQLAKTLLELLRRRQTPRGAGSGDRNG